MMQKMKAKGEEVQLIADIGMSILVEVTSQFQQHSCKLKLTLTIVAVSTRTAYIRSPKEGNPSAEHASQGLLLLAQV